MIECVSRDCEETLELQRRWGYVAVPVTAAIFMLLALAATSLVVMAQREAHREAQRLLSMATEPSPTDLILVSGFDVWRNEEYTVRWIEPAGSARPVLPPGVNRLPEPGEAVVSPALDRLASQNPDLAARYPKRFVLGVEGIRSGDELFAYVRIGEDHTLVESRLAARVSGFGSSSGEERSLGSDVPKDPERVSNNQAVTGTLGFLVVPGLVVLVAGLAAAPSTHTKSFERRRQIGASERRALILYVLEMFIITLPSLALVTVSWSLISPQIDQVPLVAHGVVRGDLQLPWWLLVVGLVVAIALTALLAITVFAVARVRYREKTIRRRAGSDVVPSWLCQIPLGVVLVALALDYVLIGPEIALIFVVALVVVVPFALPTMLHAVGARSAQLNSRSMSVAGRSVKCSPYRVARPFVGISAVVVLAVTCVGYMTLAPHIEQTLPPAMEGAQAVFVDQVDPQPNDADRLSDVLGRGLVVAFGEGRDARKHALLVGGTCRQFAAYLPGTSCSGRSPFALTTVAERKLVEILAPVAESADTKVYLVPPGKVGTSGSLAVIDHAPLATLEDSVRTGAVQILPAPNVYSSLAYLLYPSPAIAWITGGSVVVIAALTIGHFVSLIGHFSTNHERALNTHSSYQRSASLETCRFALSYSSAVAVGFIAGLLSCTLLVGGSGVPMPWQGIGVVLIAITITGLVGTASVAVLNAGKRFKDSDDRSSDHHSKLQNE